MSGLPIKTGETGRWKWETLSLNNNNNNNKRLLIQSIHSPQTFNGGEEKKNIYIYQGSVVFLCGL